jgi:PAS domain S-box-containing protein
VNAVAVLYSFAAAVSSSAITLFIANRIRRAAVRVPQASELGWTNSGKGEYRESAHLAPTVQWHRDLQTNRFTYVNQQAEAILGYPTDGWLRDPSFWESKIHPDDQAVVAAHYGSILAGNQSEPFEHRMVTAHGSTIWMRTSMLVAKRGSAGEVIGIMRNITERKQMEEALQEQRRLFDALMDTSPDSIYFKDLHSRFVRVNKATAAAFGLPDASHAVGKSDADFFADSHASKARQDEVDIIQSGNSLIDHEEKEVWPDGRETWVSTTKIPLYNSQREICGTVGISRNITERKLVQGSLEEKTQELLKMNTDLQREIAERRLLEGQLVQAQKLESIGQLAAGVAHEINTPIQYVGDNCRFVADSFLEIGKILAQYGTLLDAAKGTASLANLASEIESTAAEIDLAYLLEEIPQAVRQCNEGVERVAHIVKAMKEFSHPGSHRMEPVDLNRSIESTVTVCRNEWKYVAEVVTDLDPHLPPVRCLAGELNQVILNLVVNAAHAIAGAKKNGLGRIAVSTRQKGEFVEISIKDNGTGIPVAIQSRIFDPFFTTKEVGKGTGQGLAIARNVIVKKHGGTLDFQTQEGSGTTFCIQLPVNGRRSHEYQKEELLADA